MRSIVRIPLLAAVSIAVLSLTAPSALASAFYNKSESGSPNPMTLDIDCGVGCGTTKEIAVGDYWPWKDRGPTGMFDLLDVGTFTGQGPNACELDGRDHPNLETHGWAELHFRNNNYYWDEYGSDNNPISGSPFQIKFGTFGDGQCLISGG